MNPRIKELIEQATVTCEHATGDPYSVFDEELFARLIVQKCAMVCEEYINHPSHREGRLRCAEDVKAYFGIEE